MRRLESYQSGGSVGSNDDDKGKREVLRSQFSLIGLPSEVGSGGGEETNNEGCPNKYCLRPMPVLLFIFLIVASSMLSPKVSEKNGWEENTCPIQASFGIPQDVIKLKNLNNVQDKRRGAVATDHEVCSKLGVSILRDHGGNAADAAVTTALCLGVVNPSSSGLGGGAFILIHFDASHVKNLRNNSSEPPFEDARSDATKLEERERIVAEEDVMIKEHSPSRRGKVTEVIDCRETAPMNATFDMYEALPPESSIFGGLSIAVPGELRGVELLHYRHGSLAWAEVVRPAMELARDGFQVSRYLATMINETKKYFTTLPDLALMLTKNNDGVTPLKEGDVMKRKDFAKTLEIIMEKGANVLYEGDLAEMLASDIQRQGGIITSNDLSNYRPVLRDPLIASVAGYQVVGVPPPSSGGATIIGLIRFLSEYTLPLASLADTLSKHWYVEACKHVFAIRMSLSDPKYDHEKNEDAVADLVKGDYIGKLQKMTSSDRVLNLSQYGGEKWAQLEDTDGGGNKKDAQEGDRRRNLRLFNYLDDHGTSSCSIVDENRNSVTITSSVNLGFGSKVASPSTGFFLNNQMDDFATPGRANFFGLKPSESNYIMPGKRPLSSMSPTMVFRNSKHTDSTLNSSHDRLGELVLTLGGSGGPKIITSVAQVIINHLFIGMPLYESIMAARIHDQLVYHGAAAAVVEEKGQMYLPKRTRLALEARGQQLIPTKLGLGTVQAISVDLETNTLSAVSDIRKNGVPDAY